MNTIGMRILFSLALAILCLGVIGGPIVNAQEGTMGGSATYVTFPITIDGVATSNEWSQANLVTFTNFQVRYKNDDQFLYILLDVIQDTGNDPLGGNEYASLLVDINKDSLMTAGQDISYGFLGNLLKRATYLGGGSWTGAQPCASYSGIGFGSSPASATSHRIYEFALRMSEVASKPGIVTKMGFRVSSTNPAFSENQPADVTSSFASLFYISSASPVVAYIYNSAVSGAFDEASLYQNLLYNQTGFWAVLVNLSAVETTDFSQYRAILVARDCGSVDTWLGTAAAATRIQTARKPVIGIGLGGAHLFDRWGLDIGWGDSWLTSDPVAKIYGGTHWMWNTPSSVALGATVDIYSSPINSRSVYYPVYQRGITALVSQSTDATGTHYPVISQKMGGVCYTLWGYYGQPGLLTSNGAALFTNLVVNPPCLSPVMILRGADTTAANSVASELANLGIITWSIEATSVAANDLSYYDVLVIMADTSTVWNTPANVEKIKGFKGNVVAMGDAAYWLYGKMGLQIGYPHGVSGLSGGTGRVDNPITPALRTPYPVAIDSGLTDSLYSTTPSQSAFYTGGGIPFAAKSLVRHGSMFSYSVVITESRGGLCYQMWGYNEPPSGMTTEGKLLFRNLVVAPACNWPVYLPSISR